MHGSKAVHLTPPFSIPCSPRSDNVPFFPELASTFMQTGSQCIACVQAPGPILPLRRFTAKPHETTIQTDPQVETEPLIQTNEVKLRCEFIRFRQEGPLLLNHILVLATNTAIEEGAIVGQTHPAPPECHLQAWASNILPAVYSPVSTPAERAEAMRASAQLDELLVCQGSLPNSMVLMPRVTNNIPQFILTDTIVVRGIFQKLTLCIFGAKLQNCPNWSQATERLWATALRPSSGAKVAARHQEEDAEGLAESTPKNDLFLSSFAKFEAAVQREVDQSPDTLMGEISMGVPTQDRKFGERAQTLAEDIRAFASRPSKGHSATAESILGDAQATSIWTAVELDASAPHILRLLNMARIGVEPLNWRRSSSLGAEAEAPSRVVRLESNKRSHDGTVSSATKRKKAVQEYCEIVMQQTSLLLACKWLVGVDVFKNRQLSSHRAKSLLALEPSLVHHLVRGLVQSGQKEVKRNNSRDYKLSLVSLIGGLVAGDPLNQLDKNLKDFVDQELQRAEASSLEKDLRRCLVTLGSLCVFVTGLRKKFAITSGTDEETKRDGNVEASDVTEDCQAWIKTLVAPPDYKQINERSDSQNFAELWVKRHCLFPLLHPHDGNEAAISPSPSPLIETVIKDLLQTSKAEALECVGFVIGAVPRLSKGFADYDLRRLARDGRVINVYSLLLFLRNHHSDLNLSTLMMLVAADTPEATGVRAFISWLEECPRNHMTSLVTRLEQQTSGGCVTVLAHLIKTVPTAMFERLVSVYKRHWTVLTAVENGYADEADAALVQLFKDTAKAWDHLTDLSSLMLKTLQQERVCVHTGVQPPIAKAARIVSDLYLAEAACEEEELLGVNVRRPGVSRLGPLKDEEHAQTRWSQSGWKESVNMLKICAGIYHRLTRKHRAIHGACKEGLVTRTVDATSFTVDWLAWTLPSSVQKSLSAAYLLIADTAELICPTKELERMRQSKLADNIDKNVPRAVVNALVNYGMSAFEFIREVLFSSPPKQDEIRQRCLDPLLFKSFAAFVDRLQSLSSLDVSKEIKWLSSHFFQRWLTCSDAATQRWLFNEVLGSLRNTPSLDRLCMSLILETSIDSPWFKGLQCGISWTLVRSDEFPSLLPPHYASYSSAALDQALSTAVVCLAVRSNVSLTGMESPTDSAPVPDRGASTSMQEQNPGQHTADTVAPQKTGAMKMEEETPCYLCANIPAHNFSATDDRKISFKLGAGSSFVTGQSVYGATQSNLAASSLARDALVSQLRASIRDSIPLPQWIVFKKSTLNLELLGSFVDQCVVTVTDSTDLLLVTQALLLLARWSKCGLPVSALIGERMTALGNTSLSSLPMLTRFARACRLFAAPFTVEVDASICPIRPIARACVQLATGEHPYTCRAAATALEAFARCVQCVSRTRHADSSFVLLSNTRKVLGSALTAYNKGCVADQSGIDEEERSSRDSLVTVLTACAACLKNPLTRLLCQYELADSALDICCQYLFGGHCQLQLELGDPVAVGGLNTLLKRAAVAVSTTAAARTVANEMCVVISETFTPREAQAFFSVEDLDLIKELTSDEVSSTMMNKLTSQEDNRQSLQEKLSATWDFLAAEDAKLEQAQVIAHDNVDAWREYGERSLLTLSSDCVCTESFSLMPRSDWLIDPITLERLSSIPAACSLEEPLPLRIEMESVEDPEAMDEATTVRQKRSTSAKAARIQQGWDQSEEASAEPKVAQPLDDWGAFATTLAANMDTPAAVQVTAVQPSSSMQPPAGTVQTNAVQPVALPAHVGTLSQTIPSQMPAMGHMQMGPQSSHSQPGGLPFQPPLGASNSSAPMGYLNNGLNYAQSSGDLSAQHVSHPSMSQPYIGQTPSGQTPMGQSMAGSMPLGQPMGQMPAGHAHADQSTVGMGQVTAGGMPSAYPPNNVYQAYPPPPQPFTGQSPQPTPQGSTPQGATPQGATPPGEDEKGEFAQLLKMPAFRNFLAAGEREHLPILQIFKSPDLLVREPQMKTKFLELVAQHPTILSLFQQLGVSL